MVMATCAKVFDGFAQIYHIGKEAAYSYEVDAHLQKPSGTDSERQITTTSSKAPQFSVLQKFKNWKAEDSMAEICPLAYGRQ